MSSVGSVYQRADGLWVAAYKLNGKKLVKYGQTKREAQDRLKDLLNAAHGGSLAAPTRLTLSAWVDQWMSLQEQVHRPSTHKTYRDTLRPILARIGKTRLDNLTPVVLELTFFELRRAGIGTRRIQQGYAALHTCLGAAVRLGILGVSPMDRVSKPKHVAKERTVWSTEQVGRFVQAATESRHRYAPLLLLLVCGGLRLSEGLALTRSDLDLTAGMVRVGKAIVFAGCRATRQDTKSPAGRRTVTLPSVAREALSQMPLPLDAIAPLFTTEGGLPPGQTVLRATMQALCKRAEVPVITIHDLRHAHASVLVGAGVDVASVSKRLGHSKISTTVNIYTHRVRPDGAAVDAFECAIGAASRENRRPAR